MTAWPPAWLPRHLPLSVDIRAISIAEGVRAGLSVAVIIAMAEFLGLPPLREAALAALLTCLCDPGGPIRRRVPVLLAFALVGTAVTAGFGLLRGLGPVTAVGIGTIGLFGASFVRIYGLAPQQLGALLSVVMILSLDQPIPDLRRAALLGTSFLGGALWSALLTLVIWRIYPYRPARRAVAEAYRRLSELVRDLTRLTQTNGISDADWDTHARLHRGSVRAAIEAARTIILDTLRARGTGGNRGAQSLIRLETADQIFGSMIALSDLLERGDAAERAAAAPILRRMRPLLLILGRVILTEDADAHRRIDRAIDGVARDAIRAPADSAFRATMDRICERLRIAHTLAVPANFEPGVDAAGRPIPLRDRITGPVRDNLTWRSAALRHALRTALAAIGPLIFTMVWFTPYDHWLTISVVATMQPYISLTLLRAVERVAGTAAGGVIAACVGLLCTTPLAIAGAMFPLAVAALALRAVSFGLFTMAITPLVVLLVESGEPGTSGWHIAVTRAALAAGGGLIAVGAGLVLWPSREPDLLVPEVRRAMAAHARYAEAAFADLLDPGKLRRTAARGGAGVATNALEALISRILVRPEQGIQIQLEAALVVAAALRRTAGRIAALSTDPDMADVASSPQLDAWRVWITASLHALSRGRTALGPRPASGETDALRRIARQIELMAGAMERLPN
jgi:uncharacterized membrane protein YccC